MDVIDLLAGDVGARRPTSEAERRAAEALQGLLREAGLESGLERFSGYPTFGLPFGAVMGTAVLPALLPRRRRWLRSALALGAGAALLSEGSLRWTPLSRLLSRRRSQNVVATIEPAGTPQRTLCLMAHIDSSRSGLMFEPRYVGWLGRWITANSLFVAAQAILEPVLGAGPRRGRIVLLCRILLLASLTVLLEREIRGVDVPGANDNASGCGVVCSLAAELAAEPLEATRVVICLTGCEEAGTLGSMAFLRDHQTDGWLFLNFDNVGGGGTVRYLRREGVITRWDADPGMIAAAERVARSRPELRMAAEDAPAGLTYDASPVHANGGRALTLSVQDGFIPNLHLPSDTVENVDAGGVARTLEAGRELVAAIDAGAADATGL